MAANLTILSSVLYKREVVDALRHISTTLLRHTHTPIQNATLRPQHQRPIHTLLLFLCTLHHTLPLINSLSLLTRRLLSLTILSPTFLAQLALPSQILELSEYLADSLLNGVGTGIKLSDAAHPQSIGITEAVLAELAEAAGTRQVLVFYAFDVFAIGGVATPEEH